MLLASPNIVADTAHAGPPVSMVTQFIKELIKTECELFHEIDDFYQCFIPLHDILPDQCNLKRLLKFFDRYSQMSQNFHRGLIDCDYSVQKIENLLLKMKSEFYDTYTTYIRLYATYTSDLEMVQNDSKMKSTMMSCKNNTIAKNDVKMSLQRPFQRVTKYHLFFEPTLKDKKLPEVDREIIQRIVQFLKALAKELNMIQKEINSLRIRETILNDLVGVSTPIYPDDVGPLLKCGNVVDGSGRKRFLVVFQRVVLVCKIDTDEKYELRNFFLSSDLTADVGRKIPNSLLLKYKTNKQLIVFNSITERDDWHRYLLCIGVFQIRKNLDKTMLKFLAENNLIELQKGMEKYPSLTEEDINTIEDKIRGKKNTGMGIFKKKRQCLSVADKPEAQSPHDQETSDNPSEESTHNLLSAATDRRDDEDTFEDDDYVESQKDGHRKPVNKFSKVVRTSNSNNRTSSFQRSDIVTVGALENHGLRSGESDNGTQKSMIGGRFLGDRSSVASSKDASSVSDAEMQTFSIKSLKATIDIFEKMSRSKHCKTPVMFSVESITKGARITEKLINNMNEDLDEDWSESIDTNLSLENQLGTGHNSFSAVTPIPGEDCEKVADTCHQSYVVKNHSKPSDTLTFSSSSEDLFRYHSVQHNSDPSPNLEMAQLNISDKTDDSLAATQSSIDHDYDEKDNTSSNESYYAASDTITFDMSPCPSPSPRPSFKHESKPPAQYETIDDTLVSQITTQLIDNFSSNDSISSKNVHRSITPTKAGTIGKRLMELQQCLNQRSGSQITLRVRVGKKDISISELPENRDPSLDL